MISDGMTRTVSIIFSFLVQTWKQPDRPPTWNQCLGAGTIFVAIFLVCMEDVALALLAKVRYVLCCEWCCCCGGPDDGGKKVPYGKLRSGEGEEEEPFQLSDSEQEDVKLYRP